MACFIGGGVDSCRTLPGPSDEATNAVDVSRFRVECEITGGGIIAPYDHAG